MPSTGSLIASTNSSSILLGIRQGGVRWADTDKQSQLGLKDEEKKELEQYLVINRIFSLAKAKAIQNLLGRAQDEADRIREEKGLDSDELLKTHQNPVLFLP